MQNHKIETEIQSFLYFLNISTEHEIANEISGFFTDFDEKGEKEIVYDRGLLMLISDGKLLSQKPVPSENDRIVKFDGEKIVEVNPYAYINVPGIEMKGGDSKKKRRSGSRSGGNSNNNNNNNNNNG